MPGPVREDERARVRQLHAEGKSRNEIARELGRGVATITRITTSLGLKFDREQTKIAVAAKVVDAKARRSKLALDLLDDIDRLRDRAWSKYKIVTSGEDGPHITTLDLPPLSEARNAYTAVGICLDKHLAIARHDADTGAGAARSMLGALATGLQAAYEQLPAAGDDA